MPRGMPRRMANDKLSKILFEAWGRLFGIGEKWSDFEDRLIKAGIKVIHIPPLCLEPKSEGDVTVCILYSQQVKAWVYALIPEELAMKILVLEHLDIT